MLMLEYLFPLEESKRNGGVCRAPERPKRVSLGLNGGEWTTGLLSFQIRCCQGRQEVGLGGS